MNMYQQTPQQSSTQTTKITKYVKDLFKFGDIDYKTLQYLLPPTPPHTPIFYLLPKLHKPGNPGRPIISGCDSPTDRLSSFIDPHIKPLCSSLPSYIKDTNNFLQTIFNIHTPLPPNTIIATVDVKSLYTNIPHNEGINAILEALDTTHGRMWPTWHCNGHQDGALICKHIHGCSGVVITLIHTKSPCTSPVEKIYR